MVLEEKNWNLDEITMQGDLQLFKSSGFLGNNKITKEKKK
jgi:hypothetical protein